MRDGRQTATFAEHMLTALAFGAFLGGVALFVAFVVVTAIWLNAWVLTTTGDRALTLAATFVWGTAGAGALIGFWCADDFKRRANKTPSPDSAGSAGRNAE